MSTRQGRGRRSEHLVAAHIRRVFPLARPAPAYAPGPDLEDTPATSWEVKARRGLDLAAWLRQAHRQAPPGALPVLVVRLDGQGETTVGQWPAVLPLDQLLTLLTAAGYGTHPTKENPA